MASLRRYVVNALGKNFVVAVEPLPAGLFRVSINDRTYTLDAKSLGSAWSLLDQDNQVFVADICKTTKRNEYGLVHGRGILLAHVSEEDRALVSATRGAAQNNGQERIRALIPGKVIRCLVAPGESVRAGQAVMIVEAMKMENELRTPRAGTVRSVMVKEGQAVETGETLLVID